MDSALRDEGVEYFAGLGTTVVIVADHDWVCQETEVHVPH